jgi:hypothetical protein
MSVRKALVLLLALSTLSLLVACGNSSTPPAQPPPSGAFSNTNLSGTYVFSVSGTDANGAQYAMLGAFTANGSGGNGRGGITGGTIDLNDVAFASNSPVILPVIDASINSNSFYTVGPDGRGQATLGTTTPFGNIILDFVLIDSFHGLVTEFDANATGSGTLDLQTASLTQASLAGPYALSLSGVDGNGTGTLATVGAFSLNSSGAILTGGLEDFNDNGLDYPPAQPSGVVTLGPTSAVSTSISTSSFALNFDVYAIDSTHLKFIEMDSTPILSGDAFSQPSATIPSGSLAFTMAGVTTGDSALTIGGFMVSDGVSQIGTGSNEDVNADVDGVGDPSSASVPFTASFSSAGSGRFVVSNFTSGIWGGTEPQFAAYPSSGGVLMMEIDNQGILTGAAYPPQTSGATFAAAQGYGLNLSGLFLSEEGSAEIDDIAEFSTSASGSTCGSNSATLCGLIDENYTGAGSQQYFGQALDGTYGAIDTSGRYGISAATGNSSTGGTLNGGFGLTLYTVDGTTFPFIESDTTQLSTGVMVLQNAAATSDPEARSHMFVPRPFVKPHGAKQLKQRKQQ